MGGGAFYIIFIKKIATWTCISNTDPSQNPRVKTMKTITIAAMLALSACKTIPYDPNIANLASIQAAEATARADGFKACALAADVSACMLGIVAATAVSAGGRNSINYQRPPTPAEQFIGFAKALTPAIGGLASAAVSWRQSDNNRDVAIAQYGYLEGIVRHTTQAATAVAGSGPTINVGGNYGDTSSVEYGDGYTGANRYEIEGGVAGRDHVRDVGVFGNENRLNSPDNSHNGGPCTAAQGGISGSTGRGGDSAPCRAGNGG